MEAGFPINVLNNIKMVPEVVNIFCATANPVQVVVAETEQSRGIMGVIDEARLKEWKGLTTSRHASHSSGR